MITFDVDTKLRRIGNYFRPFNEQQKGQYLKQGLGNANIKGETVEAYAFNSDSHYLENPSKNGFLMTVFHAFNEHQSLTMGPDDSRPPFGRSSSPTSHPRTFARRSCGTKMFAS